MIRYSTEPRYWIYIKVLFLSLAKNMVKCLSSKQGQRLLDSAKKTSYKHTQSCFKKRSKNGRSYSWVSWKWNWRKDYKNCFKDYPWDFNQIDVHIGETSIGIPKETENINRKMTKNYWSTSNIVIISIIKKGEIHSLPL